MSIQWVIGAAAATLAIICNRDTSRETMNEDNFKDYINAIYNPNTSPDYKYDHFLNENEERGFESIFSWSDRWFRSQHSLLTIAKEKLIEHSINQDLVVPEDGMKNPSQYHKIGKAHVFASGHSTLELLKLYEEKIEMEIAKNPERYVICIEGHNLYENKIVENKLSDIDFIKSMAVTMNNKTDPDTLKAIQSQMRQLYLSGSDDFIEAWFLKRVAKTLNIPIEDSTILPNREIFEKAAKERGIDFENLVGAWYIALHCQEDIDDPVERFQSFFLNRNIEDPIPSISLSHEGMYPHEFLDSTKRYFDKFDTMESLSKDVFEKYEYVSQEYNKSIEQYLRGLKQKYPDKTFVIYIGRLHLPVVEAAFGD